jgi:uncharacterized protein (TIGR02453 family)
LCYEIEKTVAKILKLLKTTTSLVYFCYPQHPIIANAMAVKKSPKTSFDLQIVLKFLKQLRANNSRDWFQSNDSLYREAKKQVECFLIELIESLTAVEPSFTGLQPKDCMFRINRDVRFSKDKSPYKTNFGLVISAHGKKSPRPLFYVHLEPGGSFCGLGVYMPPTDVLAKIRQEIDYNFAEFSKILQDKKLIVYFKGLDEMDKLARPPKGYAAENPAIEHLKNKSFILSCNFSDAEVIATNFTKDLTARYKAAKSFNSFLDRAFD